MLRDRYEKVHQTQKQIREAVEMIAGADFDTAMSLAAVMGLLQCIHAGEFPCYQCLSNRVWNEAATGRKLTDAEFEAQYAKH